MKNEYTIINKSVLEKRIKELEDQLKTLGDTYEEEIHSNGFISGEINQLKKILSQSTALIPEIEKAFDKGVCAIQENSSKLKVKMPKAKQDYISNLKLDI